MPEVQTVGRVALRVPEAAKSAGVSRAFLYRAISDGSIRSTKLGKMRLIRTVDLEAWVAGAADLRK